MAALGLLLLPSAARPQAPEAMPSTEETEPAGASAPENPELATPMPDFARFVVQTRNRQNAASLAERVQARYGRSAVVEPLFERVDPESDPEGMARMFRVKIPQESLRHTGLWDAAYALKEELELEEAEPDFEAVYPEALESTRQCFVDGEPPSDRAWSVKSVSAVAAWQLVPPGTGRRLGDGISICHPDTGWAEHDDLDSSRLDLTRARNLLGAGPPDARDPLDYSGPLLNPGHGTGTGTVIVSGHQQGEILGIAPRAKLVPVRTAKSVVRVLDSDLARAVNHAVDAGCDVVSMSLGGRAFFGLRAAIRRAVRSGLIVAAAAGNCVGFVVAPAAYPECLAIAGTNIDQKPWRGSSRGKAVDVSAPGEHVWTARRREATAPTTDVTPGQGTSYAVANVAGAAALWLAYHDLSRGRTAMGGAPLQEIFREVVRRTATVPAGWNSDYGAGILNVEALLKAPLPPPEAFPAPIESAAENLGLLAAVVDRSPAELAPLLANLFDVEIAAVESELERWGPELIQLGLSDPPEFERLLGSLAGEEAGEPGERLPSASAHLRSRIR